MLKKVLKCYLPKKKKIAKSGVHTENKGLALKTGELHICVFFMGSYNFHKICKVFLKIRFHFIIYTFKYYFAIVFLIFNFQQ